MSSKKSAYFVTCLLLACSATLAFYSFDRFRIQVNETGRLLRWARQISTQASGMAAFAREHEVDDPVSWGIQFLGQGDSMPIARITKFHSDGSNGLESYRYSLSRGSFEYSKVLTPEDGTGIKIVFDVGYRGFLGTENKFEGDLYLVSFFLLCMMTCMFILGSYFGMGELSGLSDFKSKILNWVSGAKTILTQLGTHFRDMVKDAQELAVAAATSRGIVEKLKERIHVGIADLHANSKNIREINQVAALAMVTVVNLNNEMNREGNAERVSELAKEVHRHLERIRTLAQKNEAAIKNIEIQLEPWATDVDQAFHAYDDVFKSSSEMSLHIRRTKESLLEQAKMIQSLNQDLKKDPTLPPVSPKSGQKRKSSKKIA